MKLIAWTILLLLSACFCGSFYAQQLERRAVEVRRTVGRPDGGWQRLLRQDGGADCVDPPATQPSSGASDVAAADAGALPY